MTHPLPTVEMLGLDALIPYANNTRTHSDEQVAQVAASIREFGFTNPVLVDADDGIIAGHGRVLAARKLGMDDVPCIRLAHLDENQKRAYIIADNKLALNAGWDDELLALELGALSDDGFDVSLTGFSEDEIAALVVPEVIEGLTDEDDVPEVPEESKTVEGDIWLLGRHRLMCGDSTSIDAVKRLMDGQKAHLMHADPPYGMGKEADGVVNDNLYNEELDNFQMEWWATFRTFLHDNASSYIWGNAPELWRLWYKASLADSELLELRNQIVWDKKNSPGMKSGGYTQYPTTTEHCLFFQLGNQFLGNVNVDDFPEAWEPLREYLATEAAAANINSQCIREVCGVHMFGHWFTRSQFNLIPAKHYATLQSTYEGRFKRPWQMLKLEWDKVKGGPNSELSDARSYFDNTHDVMSDVWHFSRVFGEDRHGHATPKPVAMMERVMRSSLPKDGLCVEPFGGSGSTLIGAEKTRRICYTMEIDPKYCDVIVKRWQDYTGQKAVHADTGEPFDG